MELHFLRKRLDYPAAIEPSVSVDYMQNMAYFLPMVANILRDVGALTQGVPIPTPPLATTDYTVVLRQLSTAKEIEQYHLFIQCVNGESINGVRPGNRIRLERCDQGYIAEGTISNGTTRPTKWSKPPQAPVRNVSGILAPIEDALCQALANLRGVCITNLVTTQRPVSSRMVQNYLSRGYDLLDQNAHGDVPAGKLMRIFY